MWVFLNNSMVSAVQHRTRPGMLMVRARLAGDLERVFPRAKVKTTPAGDYRFRCVVKRGTFAAALARSVEAIDYENFKGSIHADPDRSSAYMGCWSAMLRAQDAQAFRLSGSASPSAAKLGSVWNDADFWAQDEIEFQRELRDQLEDDADLLPAGLE